MALYFTLLQRFGIVCAFTPFNFGKDTLTENDISVNGKYADEPVESFLKDNEVKMIIVAEKLQTGFDAPQLGIMYVDKALNGYTAVQTLGRLSRTAEGKDKVTVVDFVNTKKEIEQTYKDYHFDEGIYA